jgi:hypothetical protein
MLRIGSVLVAAIAVGLMTAPQSALAGGKGGGGGGGGGGGNHASHASSSRGTTQGGKHIPETGMAARQATQRKHKPSVSPIVIRKHYDKASP